MDGIHTDTCFPSVDAGDRQGRCVVQELVSYQMDLENCRIVTVWLASGPVSSCTEV